MRRGLLALAFLGLTTLGCGRLIGPFFLGAPTPEEAVRRSLTQGASPEVAATFRVLGTREWEGGVIVLYATHEAAEGDRPAMQMFGYTLTRRQGGSWISTGGGAFGGSAPPSAEQLVDYGIGTNNDLAIIFGRTLAPEVAAVEATFSNGESARDATEDGVFALVSEGAASACELRVLGADDRELGRFDLTPHPAPGKERGRPENACPPPAAPDAKAPSAPRESRETQPETATWT